MNISPVSIHTPNLNKTSFKASTPPGGNERQEQILKRMQEGLAILSNGEAVMKTLKEEMLPVVGEGAKEALQEAVSYHPGLVFDLIAGMKKLKEEGHDAITVDEIQQFSHTGPFSDLLYKPTWIYTSNTFKFENPDQDSRMPKGEWVSAKGAKALELPNLKLYLGSPEIKTKFSALKEGEEIMLGRDPGEDGITIPDNREFRGVSRKHLLIKKENDEIFIQDISSFGTIMR